jgi:hypothetical protein
MNRLGHGGGGGVRVGRQGLAYAEGIPGEGAGWQVGWGLRGCSPHSLGVPDGLVDARRLGLGGLGSETLFSDGVEAPPASCNSVLRGQAGPTSHHLPAKWRE